MSTPETPRTADECIEALSLTGTKRPQGIVDWMHFGLAMRYGGIKDVVEGQEEWRQLEKRAHLLAKETLNKILPLL